MFEIEDIVIHDDIDEVETRIEQFILSGGGEYLKIKDRNIDDLHIYESTDQAEVIHKDIFVRVDGVPKKVSNPDRNQFFIQTFIGEIEILKSGQGYKKTS